MLNTPLSPVAEKNAITVEEYNRLKRRLFTLRCQQAKLLCAIRDKGQTNERKQKAKKLERRISHLELKLALSDIAFPDEEPLTFHDIVHEAKVQWGRVSNTLSAYWNDTRELLLTKVQLSRGRDRRFKIS